MSIEVQIQTLIEAINDLTDAIKRQPPLSSEAPAMAKAVQQVPSEAPAAPTEASKADDQTTIDQVRAALLKVGKRFGGAPAIVELLNQFGVSKAVDLAPESYLDVVNAAQAKLQEETTDA